MNTGFPSSVSVTSVAIDPANPQVVYAATERVGNFLSGGIYKSINGGPWTLLLSGGDFQCVAVDPVDTNIIYAVDSYQGPHVYKGEKGEDGSMTWSNKVSGITAYHVYSIIIDPIDHRTLYVGTGDDGVFKSVDGADLWVPANDGLQNQLVWSVAVDPTNNQTLYAGAEIEGGSPGVYKSITGGATWTKEPNELNDVGVRNIVIDPSNSNILYAAGRRVVAGVGIRSVGVYKSTNAAQNWAPMNDGFPSDPPSFYIGALRVRPGNPATLVAGTTDGVRQRLLNAAPVAGFTMSDPDHVVSATEGQTLNLTVGEGFNSKVHLLFSSQRSSDPDGDPLTCEWLIDNTQASTSCDDFFYDVGQGSHGVSLTVRDGQGGQSTVLGTIVVTPRTGATPLLLSWPFISTTGWDPTAGNGTGDCKPGSKLYDHCGDDWFAQDWNWGSGNEDLGMVLLSPMAGRIIFKGQAPKPVMSYGQEVVIRNLDAAPYDFMMRFSHLEEIWVSKDTTICPGTPIGTLGLGGTAAHLHATNYMGVFQSLAAGGSTGYHGLVQGSLLEALNVNRPTRFASQFNFDASQTPQGCGDSFAVQGRVVVVKEQGKQVSKNGLGGVTISIAGPQSPKPKPNAGAPSGHYAFDGLTPGNYTITPSKTGCMFTPASRDFSITTAHVEIADFTASGNQCK